MRIVDIKLAFPSILLALALVAAIGAGITTVIIVIVVLLYCGSIGDARGRACYHPGSDPKLPGSWYSGTPAGMGSDGCRWQRFDHRRLVGIPLPVFGHRTDRIVDEPVWKLDERPSRPQAEERLAL